MIVKEHNIRKKDQYKLCHDIICKKYRMPNIMDLLLKHKFGGLLTQKAVHEKGFHDERGVFHKGKEDPLRDYIWDPKYQKLRHENNIGKPWDEQEHI